MDWYRVLDSPSLLDKNWYKNVRAPPIVELETYMGSCNQTLPNVLTYECINCSVPVFTYYDGKEMAVNEFAAGVQEEFLIFRETFGVVICTDSITFNSNIFYVVTCECGTELGYFTVELRPGYSKWLNRTYWARGERIRFLDTYRDMKLTEFVNDKARSVLSQLEKKELSSGELKPILTPEFMAVAGSVAVDVANRVLGNDVEDSLVPPFSHFLAEEPERLGDKQFVVQNPEEPEETHSTMLLMRLGSIVEDTS